MFGMYLVPTSIYKFKRHNNFIYWTPIKNLLTFASEYLIKFCNSYPHLSLETVFSALISQHNIFFLENCQFNHKFSSHSPTHTKQAWNTVLTIWQNMKVSRIQKFQFSNSLVNWEKFGSTAQANIQESQNSISFMNQKILRSPTTATLTNLNFQSFCNLRKSLKYSLSSTVENKGNLHKIRQVTFQT